MEKQSILSLIRSKKYLKNVFAGSISVFRPWTFRYMKEGSIRIHCPLLGTRFRARFRATGKRRHMEIRLTACGKPSYGLFPSLIPERSSSLCFWQGDKQLKSQDKEKEPQAKA
ncbi:MAG: hypothetical protein U0O46_04490 [Gemmiger qucibialis]